MVKIGKNWAWKRGRLWEFCLLSAIFFSCKTKIALKNKVCGWWQPWNEKMLTLWKKSYDKLRQCIKKQRHHFANKGLLSQSYGFSSSHVQMWELDYKEGWVRKNWSFWTMVLEKTLESPLENKEIIPVNPQGNQPWIFSGKTDAKAPLLWPLDVNSQFTGKDPDATEGRRRSG